MPLLEKQYQQQIIDDRNFHEEQEEERVSEGVAVEEVESRKRSREGERWRGGGGEGERWREEEGRREGGNEGRESAIDHIEVMKVWTPRMCLTFSFRLELR